MHASQIDFVTALSSEEQCPVCRELHASVDQSVCSVCATTMCPDCASLRPDASWICSGCASVAPSRAVPARTRFTSLRGARLGSIELARQSYRELQRGSRRTRARVAVFAASFFALCAVLGGRVLAALRVALARLMDSEYGVRARGKLGVWLRSIRNIDLREQLNGMLIATALLIAVARYEHRHNSR